MSSPAPTRPDQFEALLLSQREALLQRIREHLHRSDDPQKLSLANHLDSAGDWVEADVFAENDLAMVRHELTELSAVEAALKRCADRSYGICASCGEEIDRRRLAAAPAAENCLGCQKAFEKAEGSAHRAGI